VNAKSDLMKRQRTFESDQKALEWLTSIAEAFWIKRVQIIRKGKEDWKWQVIVWFE